MKLPRSKKWLFLMLAAALLFAADIYFKGAGLMRRIDFEGISFSVPGNFPKPSIQADGEARILSFSLTPHAESKKFVHFFEAINAEGVFNYLGRIPREGYKLGLSQEEEVLVGNRQATLKSMDLDITHPCGTRQAVKLYALEYACGAKDRHIYLLTFTMTRNGFLEIAKTIRCQ